MIDALRTSLLRFAQFVCILHLSNQEKHGIVNISHKIIGFTSNDFFGFAIKYNFSNPRLGEIK